MKDPTVAYEALTQFSEKSELLKVVDADGRMRLATVADLESYDAGQTVVNQGDVSQSFYMLVSGRVRVMVEEAGPEPVAHLEAGAVFGEVAALSGEPRSATVIATRPSELMRFERAPVLRILKDYPALREVLTRLGLDRTESNFQRSLDAGDAFADLLEPEEP